MENIFLLIFRKQIIISFAKNAKMDICKNQKILYVNKKTKIALLNNFLMAFNVKIALNYSKIAMRVLGYSNF